MSEHHPHPKAFSICMPHTSSYAPCSAENGTRNNHEDSSSDNRTRNNPGADNVRVRVLLCSTASQSFDPPF